MLGIAGLARRQLGELTGGEEGRDPIAESNTFFNRVEVASPALPARLHFNGFSQEGQRST